MTKSVVPNNLATDLRDTNLAESSIPNPWRYFDGAKREPQTRNPYRRFPWMAFLWIAAGIGLVAMFSDRLAEALH